MTSFGIERVTMLEIVPKREMFQEVTLQGPITIIVASTTAGHMKEELIEEGMKEEEAPSMIVMLTIVLQKRQ